MMSAMEINVSCDVCDRLLRSVQEDFCIRVKPCGCTKNDTKNMNRYTVQMGLNIIKRQIMDIEQHLPLVKG